MLSRKKFLGLAGAVGSLKIIDRKAYSMENKPSLSRIKMATIGAPDIQDIEKWYTKWLNYRVTERANVSEKMADSWGCPNTAGKPFILMHSAGTNDVYIRAVEVEPIKNYQPMTTWGWNAIEIIVDNIDEIHEKMLRSDFKHIGGPENLMGGTSSIRAAQYIGPAKEVIYLTCETGDRSKSTLPIPKSSIDRPFIMILAGPDLNALETFYGDHFQMEKGLRFTGAVEIISTAQKLLPTTIYPLGLLRLRENGNNIELDEYPKSTKPRPNNDGELPPGIAMTTFNVDNLDKTEVQFISEPIREYEGKRSAVFIGPAGELTELIENPRG